MRKTFKIIGGDIIRGTYSPYEDENGYTVHMIYVLGKTLKKAFNSSSRDEIFFNGDTYVSLTPYKTNFKDNKTYGINLFEANYQMMIIG